VNELLELKDKEFQQIREMVYQMFGINLTEQKRALVLGRLSKVLREMKLSSFQEYIDYVKKEQSGEALSTLVDRISTNHTFFNREKDHFDYLRAEAFPEWIERQKKAGKKQLRIWVAGCSSGEESYMIAIILRELLGPELKNWDIGILATDVSISALEKASAGIYIEENVKHLPAVLKNKYFRNQRNGTYEVIPELKKMITHRKLNLIRPSYPFKGTFQFILCRNVMIYFDRPTRDALVARYHRYTDPNGYLFIGHSETLGRNNELYTYVKPAVYRKEQR
jgi:chemotaxis protein methyltransferase CheR